MNISEQLDLRWFRSGHLQRLSFGGFTVDPRYAAAIKGFPRFSPARLPFLIEAAHGRLQHVQIECLSYEKILKKYDRRETLFYLDPPYWNTRYYRHNFMASDFVILAARLREVKGAFIMSLNDTPEVRQLFVDSRLRKWHFYIVVNQEIGIEHRMKS